MKEERTVQRDGNVPVSVRIDQLEERIADLRKKLQKITPRKVYLETADGCRLLDNCDVMITMNYSRRTMQRFRSSGKLPYQRMGRRIYYREDQLALFFFRLLEPGCPKGASAQHSASSTPAAVVIPDTGGSCLSLRSLNDRPRLAFPDEAGEEV